MPSKNFSGFTLIELIIVIIIISILAAIAIPRFSNQTTKARMAALNGLNGAIQSAVTLAQAEYRAEGYSINSTVTSINMENTPVTVTAGNGYPAGAAGGIDMALRSFTGFALTFAGGAATFNFAPAVPNCFLTYTASTSNTLITNSGC